MDEYIKKVISMVVQDLRQNSMGYLVDIIKKTEYSLEYLRHDNWDGGIDYYVLRFYLNYTEYTKIVAQKTIYEETIYNSLSSFYNNEHDIIQGVEIIAKVDQYVDWAAIAPKENKESILRLIAEEKDTLIKAGTGVIQIRDAKINDTYKKNHAYLVQMLKQLGLEAAHPYHDLWDWYNDYNLKEMKSYQSRRVYIRDIFTPLINTLENSEEGSLQLIQYEPTGWDRIDDDVNRMREVLLKAEATADYQSVGMHGRELLISLAQIVFIKEQHISPDGTDIGSADSKRMLEAYINYCMKKHSKEREVKFARAAIDFSNELTHNRTATYMDAELCYNAVLSTVHIIRVLYKYND